MDNGDLKKLRALLTELHKGLRFLEGFLDTVKRNVGDLKSEINKLVNEIKWENLNN